MSSLPSILRSVIADIAVVRPVGEFDIASVDLLRRELVDAISPQCNHLVVDLEETSFMDAMALGIVIGAQHRIRRRGGWLRVARPQPQVRRLLEITMLDTVVEVHPTLEAAGVRAPDPQTRLVEL